MAGCRVQLLFLSLSLLLFSLALTSASPRLKVCYYGEGVGCSGARECIETFINTCTVTNFMNGEGGNTYFKVTESMNERGKWVVDEYPDNTCHTPTKTSEDFVPGQCVFRMNSFVAHYLTSEAPNRTVCYYDDSSDCKGSDMGGFAPAACQSYLETLCVYTNIDFLGVGYGILNYDGQDYRLWGFLPGDNTCTTIVDTLVVPPDSCVDVNTQYSVYISSSAVLLVSLWTLLISPFIA